MRFPLILLTALLLVGQLPAVAFSAILQPPSAVTLLGHAEQAEVYGGVCTSCPPKDDSGSSNPVPVGMPYWQSTSSRLLSSHRPGYHVIWSHSNYSSTSTARLTHTFSVTSSLNWSISGGLPMNIARAQVGNQHTTTESRTIAITVPPRTHTELLARTVREQREHNFSQYQDYSDGKRVAQGHSSVTSTRTYVENSNRDYRF